VGFSLVLEYRVKILQKLVARFDRVLRAVGEFGDPVKLKAISRIAGGENIRARVAGQ
jgi:hypothetical protein